MQAQRPLSSLTLFLSALVLLGVGLSVRERDFKRRVAREVILKANSAKERSLREVLSEQADGHEGPRAEEEPRGDGVRPGEGQSSGMGEREWGAMRGFETLSEVFAWAINATVGSSANESRIVISGPLEAIEEKEAAWEAQAEQALPQAPPEPPASAAVSGGRPPQRAGEEELVREFRLPEYEESPVDRMIRAVRVVNQRNAPAESKVGALLLIEDMCHSVDNGRDLTLRHIDGMSSIIKALSDEDYLVRAAAAWAIATCAMNNNPVQNASVSLGAVGVLVRLAANDENSVVRARALLALNAVLEFEEAQADFEKRAAAVHVLRKALANDEEVRAVRRGLNLGELLVRTNLGLWKTELEAWDIPQRVEKLLRHKDLDVRESAARLISALDGGNLQ